jgi:hypothetical protein
VKSFSSVNNMRSRTIRAVAVDGVEVARELRELIDAIDRRLPNVQRAGEDAIARDAASLRAKAQKRLDELSGDAN